MNGKRYREAVGVVSTPLRQALLSVPEEFQRKVQEIRLRAGKPLVLVSGDGMFFLTQQGRVFCDTNDVPLICSYECLEQTFRAVCGYSVHTHQREMVRGYIPLKGGHRVGIAATMVEREGLVTSVKEISSLNIRVAREIKGTAGLLPSYALKGGLLLAGPPGCGKTTLLRDIARVISGNEERLGRKVVVLDERGELAAMWDGTPQNDVGVNTDVLNGFSKTAGMEIAVRCLSPHVVICDEIGSKEEAKGLLNCVHAGVEIIATVHGGDAKQIYAKPWVMELLRSGVFTYLGLISLDVNRLPQVNVLKTKEWLYEMDGHCHVGSNSLSSGNPRGPSL